MKAEKRSVQYGSHVIGFSLVRRDRSTLEIAVEPDASVTVAAPTDAPLAAIDAKVRKRAAWIRKQQLYFAQFLPRTPERRYVPGETHRYLGRQYRLQIQAGEPEGVRRRADKTEDVRSLLRKWLLARAALKFTERLEINLLRFPEPERVRPKRLTAKRLKRRWGSMTITGHLQLNFRLVEAPSDVIDYVITHELCHVAEANHSARFYKLLESVMPDWQRRKLRLEKAMA